MKSAIKRAILVWTTLVLASLFFTGFIYARIDPETVVGLWLFDEDDGDIAEDESGKGNDGTLMGKPKWIVGKFGAALEFNGSNYVSVTHSDSLTMDENITVMCWFKTDKEMTVFEDRQALVGKHYLEYEVGIYPSGVIHTYTNDGSGGGYDEGINASMAGKLPDGDMTWELDKWYHVAWTLEGSHEIVYINGVNVGEYNKAHEGTEAGLNPLEIGRRVGGSLPFTGAIDEVAVLNVTLSQEDIQDVVEQGLEAALGMTAVAPEGKLTTTWATVKTR